jgi:FtsP/CotA-like multicopper oxidase with cupredoxin domain
MKMKKLSLLLSFAMASGVAFAAAPSQSAAKAAAPHAKAAPAKTHDVEGEFVAFDSAHKTLTLKTDTGETTAPVTGKALSQMKGLKAGDKVTVTCKDKADGTHEAAIAIKKAATTAAK